jgi:uracil-DNA glycosylase
MAFANAGHAPSRRIPDHVGEEFALLAHEAQGCRVCARMAECRAVLGAPNGDLQSRVLFVAEAPGRLGADRTGIPLFGDQSGRNFDELLRAAGLQRSDVFVTNAVLCNPRDTHGRNAAPTSTEIRNCVPFLRRTIELVDPALVIALGSVALRALALVESHDVVLKRDVAQPVAWSERILIAMYHPSPRAQLHRSMALQRDDFKALRPLLADLVAS